jgi:hypothetical protein
MQAPDAAALAKAFDSDNAKREAGRAEIIASATVDNLQFCSNHAKVIGDIDSHEFWLVEVATSRSDADTIALALAELTEEILLPQGRYFEAMFYLEYIQKAVFGEIEDLISSLSARIGSEAKLNSKVAPTAAWKTYDISKPLEQGHSQQHYYDRMRAYFAATKADKMDSLIEQLKVDYLPRLFGYFIGLSSALEKLGVESETAIRAFRDFQHDFYPDFRPGLPRAKKPNAGKTAQVAPESPVTEKKNRDIRGYGMSKGK